MALEVVVKSFIERLRADLRWIGFGGEGPGVKPREYSLLAVLAICRFASYAWENTVVRFVRFFR